MDDVPLGSLLRMLGGQNRTGDVLLDGTTPALVRFHEGRIDFATGSDLSPLRRSLDDVVDDEQWDSITAGAVTPTQAVIKVASANGLGTSTVTEAMREQTVMTLFEFAVPGNDRFSFVESADDAPAPVTSGFAVEELLYQVDERVQAWREIATTVPSTRAVFALSEALPSGISEVRLGAADWRILAAADGRRTVGEMVELLGADAFAVCSAVHRLCEAQLLEPR